MFKAKIEIQKIEIIQPYRRIPIALEKQVMERINEMLAKDIIEKVNGVSKWVSPLVISPKANDIRICVDMKRSSVGTQRSG